MPTDLTSFIVLVAVWVVTYLFHSTVSLGGAWMVLRLSRAASPTLVDRTWKAAVILPLLTASLQGVAGLSRPVCEVPLVNKAITEATLSVALFGDSLTNPGRRLSNLIESKVDQLDDFSVTIQPDETGTTVGNEWPQSVGSATLRQPSQSVVTTHHDAMIAPPRPAIERSAVQDNAFDREPNEEASVASIPVHIVESGDSGKSKLALESLDRALLITGLALCCGVFGILSLTAQTIRLARRLRGATAFSEGPARQTLNRLLQQARLRCRVRLIASGADAEPVAFGLWRWTIVLPEGIETRMRHDELTALLAHELAHLARGDIVWLWIGRMLCAGLMFQPLNWIAHRRWQQAAELLCDDWAVRQSVSPFALARCLTQVAEWRLADRVCPASLAATGSGTSLSRRVERLLDGAHRDDRWATTWRRHVVTAAVIVSSLAIGLWAPRAVGTTQVSAAESFLRGEPHISINNPAAADPEAAEWQRLLVEWSTLQADLVRMTELLASTSDSPEVHDALTTIRQGVRSIERRVQESMRQETETTGNGKSEP
ncbi:MAG: M56 family metallopeptidase [Planctomycetales bacterium]|nr:M56 family metallopeptidase [Planctomycetales bacterium]